VAIDTCPECQSLWDVYRECVSQIHRLREAAEVALHSQDHEKAKTLEVELATLEQKSVDLRQALMEHQRGFHSRASR
jgi:antirestriction protein